MKLPIVALLAALGTALSAVAASARLPARECHWVTFSAGASGVFDAEENPVFIVDYQARQNFRGVHPWLGLSWATDGAVFCGAGGVFAWEMTPTLALSVGAAPGYYERHQGVDLGGHFEIVSFVEFSHRLRRGHRVVFRVTHISNGAISERNPGMELLTIGYAVPLR